MTKRAMITGITGQDGSYLADLLVHMGYEVHGLIRQSGPTAGVGALASPNHLASIIDKVRLHPQSLQDADGLTDLVRTIRPDECYHLAAQTFVSYDPAREIETLRTNIDGTHALLSAIRIGAPGCRVLFAGSAEMFGRVEQSPQNETTPMCPGSIYGITKVAGHHLMRYFRQAHNLHASTCILFNHESPRRNPKFVTRKISAGVAMIRLKRLRSLTLGDLDARRDWGFAGDYVRAMWLMTQQPAPDDFVIATNQTHSVREFCEIAFSHVGLNYQDHVVVDPALIRPPQPFQLQGDSTRARTILGWQPTMSFKDLVISMVEHDLKLEQARPHAD